MNKLLIATVLSVVIAVLPVSAQAYVGFGLGVASTDIEHSSLKLFAGIQIMPVLGLEIAYNNFGNYHGESADAYSLAAIGTLPVDNTWDLFIKLGTTENHTKFGVSTNHRDLLTGFGIVYNATRDVSLRIEYETFGQMLDDGSANNSNVSNWGLNLKTSF
jgi:OmpA-OmpF porin, OOP family